jgi:hypothetical protein
LNYGSAQTHYTSSCPESGIWCIACTQTKTGTSRGSGPG